LNPAEKVAQKLEVAAKKKMTELTARSFFKEMVDYGFDENDIISFTTEILDLLMRKDKVQESRSSSDPPMYPVNYRQESDGRVVEILGPQLSLKPLCRNDFSLLESWRQEETYLGTLIERVFDLGVEEIFRHYDSERNEFFLVRLREGNPLGFLTYQLDWTDPTRAEMQKFLADRKVRGRGYGRQMTYLWLHYGFTKLNLRKISAKTVDCNLVNINLNRKLGFRFEGHLREEVCLRDSSADVTVMSVLRDQVMEWFESSKEAPETE
jgi:RimJ/RimL family protein N-acetyltransferase